MPTQPAILGSARLGNFRLGYNPAALAAVRATRVTVLLAGVLANARVRMAGLTVHDAINDAPNTCSLTVDGTAPIAGQDLRVSVNSDAPRLLFNGTLQTVDLSYEGKPNQLAWKCTAVDDLVRLNRVRPFGTWTTVSATTIAQSLIADFAPGFTTVNVEAGLPSVSITFDGSETFSGCLLRLANAIGGYFYVEDLDLHFFLTEVADLPDDIDSTPGRFLNDPPITVRTDSSQQRTSVYGKGYGENVPTDVLAGDTIIPLPIAEQFNPSGGQAITGTTADGAQSQVIDYTGVDLGGEGTLVGPGAAPASAPTVSLASGSGVEDGAHQYAQVWVTAEGKSLPSPVAPITVGLVSAPSSTPNAGAVQDGAGPDDGAHLFAISHVTATGETPPGPTVSKTTSSRTVTAPSAAPTVYTNANVQNNTNYSIGDSVAYAYAYVTPLGQTTPGGTSTPVTAVENTLNPGTAAGCNVSVVASADSGVTAIRVFRKVNGSWTKYHDYANATNNYNDVTGVLEVTGSPSGSNTAIVKTQQVPLSNLEVSPPLGTARKVWGTVAGDSQLKYIATINTTDTAYLVTTPDASLGANAPTSNTAAANQVTYARIAGPTGTTSREYYRTVAAGSQLKLLATLGDNSTVSNGTDSTADASLGANAPSSDTSGLTQPPGQVNAGSTSLLTAGAGPFASGGGWVALAGGQTVRYTGITGNTLTGIPPLGPGSILTTVLYGSQAIPAPALTGVTGLTLAMAKGSAVHIWVERNDVSAQAALIALDAAQGRVSDGVVEHQIIDMRRGEASLIALCDADLERFSMPIVTVTFAGRDTKLKSGKPITFNLSSPAISATLTLMTVDISEIDLAPSGLVPRFHCVASSTAVALESILRKLLTKAA